MSTYNRSKVTLPNGDIVNFQDKVSGFLNPNGKTTIPTTLGAIDDLDLMTTGICYYNSSSSHKPADSSFGIVISSKSYVNSNAQIFQVALDTETNILTRSKSGSNAWTSWSKIVNGSTVNTLITNALTIDGKKSIPTTLATLDDFDDMTTGILVYSSATLNKPTGCTNGLVVSSKTYHTDQY